jgi:signal transduction histidine kinase
MHDEEEQLLRSVARQNAASIFLARQRAERELLQAKEELEAKTAELAESLAMMHATLESTADGILATDVSGGVTGYNKRFVTLWNVPDDVLAAGRERDVLAHMAPQMPDPAGFLADVDRLLADSPAESFDVLALADSRVLERYSRVQHVGERAIGRVWSFRDITERARSEAALREAKSEAEAASRSKSAFLAMMSHELRTPLNAIAGYTELLELGIPGPVTDAQRQALNRIQASQRHLLSLIDEVLIHARLETGTLHFELAAVRVQHALASAESLVAPQAASGGLTLAAGPCPPDLMLRADPEKLQQILVNLLANAVKFTPPGGRIEVGCSAGAGRVSIFVRDTGIGIPEDQLETIFEPFVQVRTELTRTAQGTGLGLAISRALARGMGGTLTVSSEVGSGSTFTLQLPEA